MHRAMYVHKLFILRLLFTLIIVKELSSLKNDV